MIDWEKHGFEPDEEFPDLMKHKEFPFLLTERDGFIDVIDPGLEYTYSQGKIPATKRQLELLLKAFCVRD